MTSTFRSSDAQIDELKRRIGELQDEKRGYERERMLFEEQGRYVDVLEKQMNTVQSSALDQQEDVKFMLALVASEVDGIQRETVSRLAQMHVENQQEMDLLRRERDRIRSIEGELQRERSALEMEKQRMWNRYSQSVENDPIPHSPKSNSSHTSSPSRPMSRGPTPWEQSVPPNPPSPRSSGGRQRRKMNRKSSDSSKTSRGSLRPTSSSERSPRRERTVDSLSPPTQEARPPSSPFPLQTSTVLDSQPDSSWIESKSDVIGSSHNPEIEDDRSELDASLSDTKFRESRSSPDSQSVASSNIEEDRVSPKNKSIRAVSQTISPGSAHATKAPPPTTNEKFGWVPDMTHARVLQLEYELQRLCTECAEKTSQVIKLEQQVAKMRTSAIHQQEEMARMNRILQDDMEAERNALRQTLSNKERHIVELDNRVKQLEYQLERYRAREKRIEEREHQLAVLSRSKLLDTTK